MLLSLALKVEFLLTSGIFLLPLGESGFVWVSCHLSTFILDPEELIKVIEKSGFETVGIEV